VFDLPVSFLIIDNSHFFSNKKLSHSQLFCYALLCAFMAFVSVYIFAECFYASKPVEIDKRILIDSGLASYKSDFIYAEMVGFFVRFFELCKIESKNFDFSIT
jgi:hypothetical protein